jgi:limonene-1,2-epoxide hydrolase
MVHAMCAAADAADGETFASFFSDAATYRFGNFAPISGRDAIAAATTGTVDAIWPIRHEVDQIAAVGSQLFCRFTIHASAPGGDVALPCVTVIQLDGEQIVDYRVHMDIGPALRAA